MPKFTRHVFICTNQRAPEHPRGCCDAKGAAELQRLFKQKLAEHGLSQEVRANKAGCLDQCEHGATVVVYPDAVWYGGVTATDVDEIVQSHLLDGKLVARLALAEACINSAHCEHKQRCKEEER